MRNSRLISGLLVASIGSLPCPAIAQSGVSNQRHYDVPAEIIDFPEDARKQESLNSLWNSSIEGYVAIAMTGNPWTAIGDSPRQAYIDPLTLPADTVEVVQPITWTAFPNRVNWYFNQSQNNPYRIPKDLLYPLIDDGRLHESDAALAHWLAYRNLEDRFHELLQEYPALGSADYSNFAPLPVPTTVCPVVDWNQDPGEWKDGDQPNYYGPPGPRGWKDEYNEWVVTRNEEGKITRISFTAENPEYWFSLWRTDPQRVLELYRQLVNENVRIEDLYLRDTEGNVVFDYRGEPFYNPLNKWNYGNRADDDGGGAAHLTSPPNTIAAEIYLGAAATIIRTVGPADYDPQENNCYSQYGRALRNSDPNIGFQVNQIVRNLHYPISLTNPIALYMQSPDFSNYRAPDDTAPEEFFRIVRGRTSEQANSKYDQILHAVFEVPEEKGYTVSDITINGVEIWWGSQVAETFNQALAGTAYPNLPLANGRSAVSERQPPNPSPRIFVKQDVLMAIVGNDAISAATVPLVSPSVMPGTTLTDMALEAHKGEAEATIGFARQDGTIVPGITATITDRYLLTDRVVPGEQVAKDMYVYVMDIEIGEDVRPGLYGVQITNPGNTPQTPAPARLIVMAAEQ